ncbi:MAG: hypothetical protein DMH00_04105 [Acidobacteria bacterium]|nr:MAG: hypothetical protein DMH00_04105 [Acidobacteriota bacterium]
MRRVKRLSRLAVLAFGMGLIPVPVDAGSPGGGPAAPDFELEDLQGKMVRLSKLRGGTVVLHFWATWCPHCLSEMPLLQEVDRNMGSNGTRILAINLGETYRKVERYAKEHDLRLTILLDSRGKAAQAFGVVGLPTTLLLDPQGRVIGQIDMGSLSRTELGKLLPQGSGPQEP